MLTSAAHEHVHAAVRITLSDESSGTELAAWGGRVGGGRWVSVGLNFTAKLSSTSSVLRVSGTVGGIVDTVLYSYTC